MSRGRIAVLLSLLLLVAVATLSFAQAAQDRGLGLRAPTVAEQADIARHVTAVTSIPPNDLAKVRVRAELEAAAQGGEKLTLPLGLPALVDNSTSIAFPPIRSQGGQGSCSGWASTYYYNTYLQAQDEGYNASGGNNDYICSPAFIYNLENWGVDGGSVLAYCMMRLSRTGASSWTDMPYSDLDWTTWPTETAWVGALRNRTATNYAIDVNATGGLDALKQHLANGNLATLGMSVYTTWYYQYPSDQPGINNGVYYATDGSPVGGHAITAVGYDDNKAYVDHRDATTYYGAVLLANSWGPMWGVQNTTGGGTSGFFWVSYRMLQDGSFWYYDSNAYFNDDRADYRPSVYVVAGVEHEGRGNLALNSYVDSTPAGDTQYALYLDGGTALAIDDTKRVAVDMTDQAGLISGSGNTEFAAALEVDSGATSDGTVTSADFLVDLDGDGTYTIHAADNCPVNVTPGSIGYATCSYVPTDVECQITASSFPTSLEWEEVEPSASVTFQNLTGLTWLAADDYALETEAGVDRWGVTSLAMESDVLGGATYTFDFGLTAPPMTTLRYQLPVTPTRPGMTDSLPLDLSLCRSGTPLGAGAVTDGVTLSRFSDIQPGTAGAWARFYVEECAGRAPSIVGGYPDGSYRPGVAVNRDAMAVFMARSLKLDLSAYQGLFTDVPSGYWAALYIEALVDAGVVGGYPGGTYRPTLGVNRDAMAVFVARGIAGGDSGVPSGPPIPTFTDVPSSYWAYKYIEHVQSQSIVGGYPGGTYRPMYPVDRGQMAVFVYRGFLQPTGVAVVLAGPAITAADPDASDCGWVSIASGDAADPGYAYIALDAVRLGNNLAGIDSFFDVYFELREATTPTTAATGDYQHNVPLTAADIGIARSGAISTGDPYYVVSWDIPGTLNAGDYILVVSIEDETDTLRQITRTPAFTINP